MLKESAQNQVYSSAGAVSWLIDLIPVGTSIHIYNTHLENKSILHHKIQTHSTVTNCDTLYKLHRTQKFTTSTINLTISLNINKCCLYHFNETVLKRTDFVFVIRGLFHQPITAQYVHYVQQSPDWHSQQIYLIPCEAEL